MTALPESGERFVVADRAAQGHRGVLASALLVNTAECEDSDRPEANCRAALASGSVEAHAADDEDNGSPRSTEIVIAWELLAAPSPIPLAAGGG